MVCNIFYAYLTFKIFTHEICCTISFLGRECQSYTCISESLAVTFEFLLLCLFSTETFICRFKHFFVFKSLIDSKLLFKSLYINFPF